MKHTKRVRVCEAERGRGRECLCVCVCEREGGGERGSVCPHRGRGGRGVNGRYV